jgi:hypothetical protein
MPFIKKCCRGQEIGGFRNVDERTLYLEPGESSLDKPSALPALLSRLLSSVEVHGLGSNISKYPFPQPRADERPPITSRPLSRFSSMRSNHLIGRHQMPCTRATDTAPTFTPLVARHFDITVRLHPLCPMGSNSPLPSTFLPHVYMFVTFFSCQLPVDGRPCHSFDQRIFLHIRQMLISLQVGVPIAAPSSPKYSQAPYCAAKDIAGKAGDSQGLSTRTGGPRTVTPDWRPWDVVQSIFCAHDRTQHRSNSTSTKTTVLMY